jgi:hypothetical protein
MKCLSKEAYETICEALNDIRDEVNSSIHLDKTVDELAERLGKIEDLSYKGSVAAMTAKEVEDEAV